jgi:dihydroxyacetone kinase
VYVTRADAPVMGKVALLSGGGSGHEPMHCGYIGQGMLSGACPGEIFTSPTPDKMFECAMQIDGGEGVLLIIKNYTGDILNFETATELLHESGVKVTTMVVDDDVAVKDSLYTAGRRGVANTVLIEKLVGAAAERGDSLEACAALGRKLNNQGHSIGIAIGACTVPAAGQPSFTLQDNEMEFGVGIHGEPGIDRRPSPLSIRPLMKCSIPCWKTATTAARCATGTTSGRVAGSKESKRRCKVAIGLLRWSITSARRRCLNSTACITASKAVARMPASSSNAT